MQRDHRADERAAAARAVDLEPAAEHVDAVGEAQQAGPAGRVGAADAVVAHLDRELLALDRDPHVDAARLGVAGGVGERLGGHEVRAARDRQRQLALEDVDVDRHVGGLAQRRQRLPQPALAQRHRVQPARELAQLRVGVRELLLGLRHQRPRRVVLGQLHLRDAQQVRDREQPLLGAVVQVAPDAAALLVGGLDHPRARLRQPALLVAALELGAGAGGEDPQRGRVLLVGLHRPRVEHREVPEVHALRRLQAHRQVALEPELDHGLVVREALGQRLGERHPRVLGGDRAGRAGGVVLERLVEVGAVVPAGDHLDVHAGGVGGLGDHHHLGAERLGDMAHEAAQERLAHRARRTLGDGAEQIVAAEPPGAGGRGHRRIVPPLSGHAGQAALMRCRMRDDA